MPIDPKPYERQMDFLNRCINKEVELGKEQSQAAAICYAAWRDKD